jgi:hypothetical protein
VRQVHFGSGSSSAAAGGPSGPSRQHEEGDDPFLYSADHQPLHQVSIVFFNFIIQYSANLIQGGLPSAQDEEFDLGNIPPGSDDSPEPGPGRRTHQGHTTDPGSPTHRQRGAQRAGTRLASSGDDTFQFFKVINGTRQCTFCL